MKGHREKDLIFLTGSFHHLMYPSFLYKEISKGLLKSIIYGNEKNIMEFL